MLESMIVVLDAGAVSFCHYDNPAYDQRGSELIAPDALAAIVRYAGERDLTLHVLFGQRPVPHEYVSLLEGGKHIKIVPYQLGDHYPDAVLVLDWNGGPPPDHLHRNPGRNVIIRMPGSRLADLRLVFRGCRERARRINLTLTGLESFTEGNLLEYEHELAKMVTTIAGWYLAGEAVEVNALSDRLFLRTMKNCDAGVRHLTFAPNGRFYICPGFYHAKPEADVGSLATGIRIPDAELLQLERAPLCSRCDAYQCRRCVFLNKATTGEWNTPSRQQCVTSHLERNASRRLLRRLTPALVNFGDLADIPEIDYLDPLDVFRQEDTDRKIRLSCT